MAKDNKKIATSSKKEKNIKKVQYSLKSGKKKETRRASKSSNNGSTRGYPAGRIFKREK